MPIAAFPKCFIEDLCTSGRMSVDQWIDLSATFDIDGLEFYWPFTPHGSPAELARLRGRVEAQGRSIPMFCYSPDFTQPDPVERQVEVERQELAIRTAHALGAGFCRVLSGQRRPGVARADGLRWVRESIEALLPAAERYRVVLTLENHYKDGFWAYPEFAQRMDMFLELLESIPRTPWFGVNYDPSNAVIAGDDPIALLDAVKDRVVTLHASDRYFSGGTLADLHRLDADPHSGYAAIVEHGVVGEGLNDYDRIFSILAGAGFGGWVSIEDGPDPDTGADDIARSALFLRAKMAEHGLA